MKTNRQKFVKKKLDFEENDYVEDTPENRFLMVWEITKDLYSFIGSKYVEQRLPRHIGKIIRKES